MTGSIRYPPQKQTFAAISLAPITDPDGRPR